MQPVADTQEVEFRCPTFANVVDVVGLVDSDYRGASISAGPTTEADLLDKRSS